LPASASASIFLSDGGIIDAIVRAIAPLPGQPMVEIGPAWPR
jgi:16S rRNA (adenine1518-N6/adenine1519-N6)-dimethyltransferase